MCTNIIQLRGAKVYEQIPSFFHLRTNEIGVLAIPERLLRFVCNGESSVALLF